MDVEPPSQEPDEPEKQVIQTLLSRQRVGLPLRVFPGDDAAVLEDGTAITTDTLVENIHWDGRLSAQDVGWKAVMVSVSDLAAMGAQPTWMTLSLSLPKPIDLDWVRALSAGLHEASGVTGVSLIGGDTTGSPGPRFVSITMGGACVSAPITRAGARPGQDLWVTGVLGLAGLGYLSPHPHPSALAALRRPRPHLKLALALAERSLVTAMMDLSDGLTTDLPRLCTASRVGAVVDPAMLPQHEAFQDQVDPLPFQVSAGDDYQLLLTSAPTNANAITALAATHHTQITRIGRITEGPQVILRGRDWPAPQFSHFSTGGAA